jgi:hypothetical protein
LTFDHTFCILFKKYESLILLQLSEPNSRHMTPENSTADINSKGHMVSDRQSPNDVINRYKEVIRTQDETIENCKREVAQLTHANTEYKVIIHFYYFICPIQTRLTGTYP